MTYSDGHNKKATATLKIELLQPFFRNKKPQAPYLQTLVFLPHLSSSSDLRIVSSVQPSQLSPMTGFRLMQNLHTYSGGTVRDSHPVFYSLVVLLPHPQALKRNIYLRKQYTRYCTKCQSKRKVHRSSFTLLFFS